MFRKVGVWSRKTIQSDSEDTGIMKKFEHSELFLFDTLTDEFLQNNFKICWKNVHKGTIFESVRLSDDRVSFLSDLTGEILSSKFVQSSHDHKQEMCRQTSCQTSWPLWPPVSRNASRELLSWADEEWWWNRGGLVLFRSSLRRAAPSAALRVFLQMWSSDSFCVRWRHE